MNNSLPAHFCALQKNIEWHLCCQLVRHLNLPEKVPFCENSTTTFENSTPSTSTEPSSPALTNLNVSRLFQRSFPKFGPPQPSNLKVSLTEAPAEHLTFLFGIGCLISMAVICTLFLMRLTRASVSDARARCILPSSAAGDLPLMLWLPKSAYRPHPPTTSRHRHHRRTAPPPSLMVLLRSSFSCAGGAAPRHERARSAVRGRSCVSVVSSSSMNPLLPQSLTITPSPSTASCGLVECASTSSTSKMSPPPPYEERKYLKK